MSASLQKQATTTSAKPAITPLPFSVIQRKRACGGSAGMSGECERRQEKRLTINRYSTDRRPPSGLLPSRAGLAGSTMFSDHIGVVCTCASDINKKVKGFLSEYSFNLDIWFKGSDVAVRVSPGDSYGSPLDWRKIPPPGVTRVDACPVPASEPTTAPTELKKSP